MCTHRTACFCVSESGERGEGVDEEPYPAKKKSDVYIYLYTQRRERKRERKKTAREVHAVVLLPPLSFFVGVRVGQRVKVKEGKRATERERGRGVKWKASPSATPHRVVLLRGTFLSVGLSLSLSFSLLVSLPLLRGFHSVSVFFFFF